MTEENLVIVFSHYFDDWYSGCGDYLLIHLLFFSFEVHRILFYIPHITLSL